MSRHEHNARFADGGDILDHLQIDAGQRTLAALVSERALAAAEIARLRAQIESLNRRSVGVPPQPQTRADATRRAANATAARSQWQAASTSVDPFPPNSLMRLKDVSRLVGLSRSSLYKGVADGTFPHPVRVGKRSVRWRVQDILDWSAGLAEA